MHLKVDLKPDDVKAALGAHISDKFFPCTVDAWSISRKKGEDQTLSVSCYPKGQECVAEEVDQDEDEE